MGNLSKSLIRIIGIFSGILIIFGTSVTPMASAKKVSMALADSQQSAVSTDLGIYGGDNWDIAVDGDHVYTIANGVPNGFFYSTDAAATWQRPTGTYDFGSGTAVEVDPTTHAVYIALDGLFKSSDYGVTLTKIADSVGNPLLFAQGRLFATHNDTIYVSSDNGATFATVAISGENIMSYAASKTAGTFYAVTRNSTTSAAHLYTSTDYGVTWTAITVDASVTSYTDVNADPYDASILTLSGDNALWLSLNAGTSWTKIGVTPARSCGNFSVWTSTRWYACAGYSTDNGTTWTNMDTHTYVMRGPGKIIAINTADEDIIYGDCMSGICKSTDGGLTWHNSLKGITGVNVLAISYTTDKTTAWVSSSNGLAKTSNFNSTTPTWTWPILPCDPSPSARCDSSGIGESVWVKPNDPTIVMAGSIGGWVYRSTDSGTTWTAQIPTVVNQAKFKTDTWNNLRPKHFLSDPTDANILYLAMYDPIDNNGAVLKSTDAGITWTDMGIADDAPATVLSMTKTGVLYAGTGYGKSTTTTKGIYKFDGASWTKLVGIETSLNIISILVDPEVETTVYATAANDLAPLQLDGFYKSIDSGATWTKIVPTGYTDFGAITVQKNTSPNTLYMSASDSANHGILLKSSDQGATWGVLYQGLKSESYGAVVFDGLVVGSKHGLFGLKSKGTFLSLNGAKVKAKVPVKLSATLKDKATKKILSGKLVKLYYKEGNKWKLKATAVSNKKGKVTFTVKTHITRQYHMAWAPGKIDKNEYAGTDSSNVTITIKK
ncbi:MAG: hypothetical protein WCT08_00895 [Patescibacteria group bacterium]|jgi:photosystem II stability/assembly factor-like uncharacterized protein